MWKTSLSMKPVIIKHLAAKNRYTVAICANHRLSCSAEQFPAPSKVTGSIPQIASNESPLRSGQPNSNPGAVNIDIDANSIKIEYEDDYEWALAASLLADRDFIMYENTLIDLILILNKESI